MAESTQNGLCVKLPVCEEIHRDTDLDAPELMTMEALQGLDMMRLLLMWYFEQT